MSLSHTTHNQSEYISDASATAKPAPIEFERLLVWPRRGPVRERWLATGLLAKNGSSAMQKCSMKRARVEEDRKRKGGQMNNIYA